MVPLRITAQMRRLLRFLIWAISIYLLLCTAAAIFLADVAVHPYRRPLPIDAENGARQTAANLYSQLADVAVEAGDHASLRAWFIQPQHGNDQAVILLHGLGDNRMGTAGYAQLLLAHGYSVLMPDARAHGESGGDLATYGIVERDDIRRWFEWLDHAAHPTCIYGLGESMGAAQLLQSLAAEPRFCAVVAESSFSTFREIAYDRMGRASTPARGWDGTVLRPVVELALAIVHVRYSVDLADAAPAQAVADTRVPVLLIHGQVDGNIPIRHSWLIKAGNGSVTLWEVAGADHCGAIAAAPAQFEQRVIFWLQSHQRSRTESLVRAAAAK